MKKIFISLSPNPPDGFEYRTPTKRDLLSNQVAIFADSLDAPLALLVDFSDRVYGVVITEGETFSHNQLGLGLWHLIVPGYIRPDLSHFVSCSLDIMAQGLMFLEENRNLKTEQLQSRKVQEQILSSYNTNRERLGKLVEDLRNEIESRKQADEALKESEERYSILFDEAQDGIVLIDGETGKIVQCNREFERQTGRTIDQLKEMNIWEIRPERIREIARKKFFEIKENGTGHSNKLDFQKPDDTIVPIEFTSKKLKIHNKWYFLSICRDITERVRIEKALRESEERYRSIFNNSAIGIGVRTPDNSYIEFNEHYINMLGYSEEELKNLKTEDITHPDDIGVSVKNLKDIKEGKAQFRKYEKRYIRKDGEIIWAEVSIQGMKDDEGTVYAITGVVNDITDRKKLIRALRDNEERIRETFNAITDAVFLHPLAEEGFLPFVDVNDTACEKYGYSREEFLRLTAADISKKADVNHHSKVESRAELRSGKRMIFEVTHITRSGEEFPVEINSAIIELGGRDVELSVARDITERKLAEKVLQEHKDLLHAIIESTADGILVVDNNGKVIHSNRQFVKLWQIPEKLIRDRKDEALLQYVLDQLIDPEAFLAKVQQLYQSQDEILDYLYFKDGRVFERYSYPLDQAGKLTGRIWSFRDITERMQAEKELHDREENLRITFNSIGDAVIAADTSGAIVRMNPVAERLTGWTLEAARGKLLNEVFIIVNAQTGEPALDPVTMVLKNGEIVGLANHTKLISKDGSEYQIADSGAPIKDADGNITGVVLVFRDVTEKYRIREKLRASEETYRNLFQNAQVGLFRTRIEDGKILESNEQLAKMFGYDNREDLIAEYITSENYVDPGTREKMVALIKEKGYVANYEARFYRRDRSIFWASYSARIYPERGWIEGVAEDITRRKLAEMELRDSEAKFRKVIEQSNDAIYILYQDRFDLINPRFTEITGITIEEAQSPDFNFMESLIPESKELVAHRKRMWERGERPPSVYEFSLVHKNGELHYVQASITEIEYRDGKAFLGILRDISEQKALKEQLFQAQKIESIGHLAGGIAHDFNNLLTPILGNAELAMMEVEPSNPLFEDLREIHETASRASKLTQQLLAFSRKQVLEMKIANLNRLIEDFRKILRRTVREDIKIEFKYGAQIGMIKVDVSQIEQILMNLVVNAQDAMPAGGIITIETGTEELDENYAESHASVLPGQYAMLVVSDTGEGMDEQTMQNIFDPFFTTKELGRGTGLGLSTVYGIVKQHGGSIWVYSEPGEGTTFKIYLPMIRGEVTTETIPKRQESDYQGTETILIVEDQEQVRKVAARILTSHGYTVLQAGNGEEAVAIVRDQELPIDLLLTDVIMPNMNGKELHDILSGIQPGLKVIYMSGYTHNVISHQGILDVGTDFISKPLRVESLAKKVKQVLGRAGKS